MLNALVNLLEHNHEDDFMTEQIFYILSGLVKKCYIMIEPRQFFEELLSPFNFKPIIDFTFN